MAEVGGLGPIALEGDDLQVIRMSNIQKYKSDFEALANLGEDILKEMKARLSSNQSGQALINPDIEYQLWYTEAYVLIGQLLPGRLEEFQQIYQGYGNNVHETIQRWLNGQLASYSKHPNITVSTLLSLIGQFENQLNILKSLERRFESTLFDIKQLVQADLFDSELDAARELVNRGFLRAAGAVSGVVLERHLNQVAENHNIEIRKKNCTIGDFNEILKKEEVLEVPEWRQIQWLGDIRNLCDHNKEREPTLEEVEGLIKGVDKCTKTLF